jgi:hypothetical protein
MRYIQPTILSCVSAVSSIKGSDKGIDNQENTMQFTPGSAYEADE